MPTKHKKRAQARNRRKELFFAMYGERAQILWPMFLKREAEEKKKEKELPRVEG